MKSCLKSEKKHSIQFHNSKNEPLLLALINQLPASISQQLNAFEQIQVS